MSRSISPRQSGAALVTALIVMTLVLMISASAVKFSALDLKMAINEELRVSANQTVQAAVDAALANAANTPVIGGAGDTNCTAGHPQSCIRNDLTLPAEFSADISAGAVTVLTRRDDPPLGPPPRGLDTSIKKFQAAPFDVQARYDRLDQGLGQAQLNEGLILLVPRF